MQIPDIFGHVVGQCMYDDKAKREHWSISDKRIEVVYWGAHYICLDPNTKQKIMYFTGYDYRHIHHTQISHIFGRSDCSASESWKQYMDPDHEEVNIDLLKHF